MGDQRRVLIVWKLKVGFKDKDSIPTYLRCCHSAITKWSPNGRNLRYVGMLSLSLNPTFSRTSARSRRGAHPRVSKPMGTATSELQGMILFYTIFHVNHGELTPTLKSGGGGIRGVGKPGFKPRGVYFDPGFQGFFLHRVSKHGFPRTSSRSRRGAHP